MTDREELISINYVSDCDTSMYEVYELDGGLHENEIKHYIKDDDRYNNLIAYLDKIKRKLVNMKAENEI